MLDPTYRSEPSAWSISVARLVARIESGSESAGWLGGGGEGVVVFDLCCGVGGSSDGGGGWCTRKCAGGLCSVVGASAVG